ncbi:MAG: uracil-DNA glycosylase [Leadbetterella sp.]
MNIKIEKSWEISLNQIFEKKYFIELVSFVKSEYSSIRCFPPGKQIFNAFDLCPLPNVKVVILGQDPYHGLGQAHGLSFSVSDGIPFPPSLRNIFKELNEDLNVPIPNSGNLTHWAQQGVLLLNSTLTVRENQAGSHQKHGWETFTDEVISTISKEKENVVFMLWGAFAQAKTKLIDNSKHCILTAKHPSPLSANQGGWFGCKHFSKANEFLSSKGINTIDW